MKNSSRWTLVVLAIVTIVALSGCGSGGGGVSTTNPFEGSSMLVFGYTVEAPNGWLQPVVGDDGRIPPTLVDFDMPDLNPENDSKSKYTGQFSGHLNSNGQLNLSGVINRYSGEGPTKLKVNLTAQLAKLPPGDPNDKWTRFPTYGGQTTIKTENVSYEPMRFTSHTVKINYWSQQ